MFTKRSILGMAASTVVFLASGAMADEVTFEGETITIIVPFGEGGGSDTFARTLQAYLTRHLPGEPTVLVENMPGGGSIKGANFFQRADPDGLTALVASTSTFTSAVFGGPQVEYDMTSWEPVVLTPQGSVLFTKSDTGIGGMDPVEAAQTLATSMRAFGIKAPTASELRAVAAFNLLGITDITPVFGLSAGERRQAMVRGELDLGVEPFSGYSSKVAPFIESGELTLFATLGYVSEDGTVVRDPGLPDVMTVPEIYQEMHGTAPEGPLWNAYLNLLNMGVMTSKSLNLPEGTSPEIVAAWRGAVDAMLADPEFIEIAADVLGPYEPVFGDAAKAAIAGALTMDDAQREWLFGWVEETMGVPVQQ